MPGHRGATPRGLGDHRAGRRRRADGHRDPLRAAAGAGRGGRQRNVARFHAACSDVPENMELFGQLGFMAYAQEEIFYRPPEAESAARLGCAACSVRKATATRRGGPAPALQPAGARRLAPLRPVVARHAAGHRPHRGLPGIRLGVGGHEGVVPRSSLNPLLHFSGVNACSLPGSSAPAASRSTAAAEAALPAVPDPRGHRRGIVPAVRARGRGQRGAGGGHPVAGANI